MAGDSVLCYEVFRTGGTEWAADILMELQPRISGVGALFECWLRLGRKVVKVWWVGLAVGVWRGKVKS